MKYVCCAELTISGSLLLSRIIQNWLNGSREELNQSNSKRFISLGQCCFQTNCISWRHRPIPLGYFSNQPSRYRQEVWLFQIARKLYFSYFLAQLGDVECNKRRFILQTLKYFSRRERKLKLLTYKQNQIFNMLYVI